MKTPISIDFNRRVHDKVARKYKKIHTEIYNNIEQARIKSALKEAVSIVSTGGSIPQVIDVGCGAGNLTSHLVSIGLDVTAADISDVFLKMVKDKYPVVRTHVLNGEDLSEIENDTYDMVATYSVLHHIPDYLKMVKEMCRVVKPGGVLYIDHEKNDAFWNQEPTLREFYRKQKYSDILTKIIRRFKSYANPIWYINRYRRYINPRYQPEGDIHVWPDDHVEWVRVKETAANGHCNVVHESNYLHFNSRYSAEIYYKYRNIASDMTAIVFKKTSSI
jgi:ubiquinone/menaquinone biosynthesis C-methylase UbiE